MNVLFLSRRQDDLHTGGVAEVFQGLSNVFPNADINLSIYVKSDSNSVLTVQKIDSIDGKTSCYKGPFPKPGFNPYNKKRIKPMMELIDNNKIDLIHAHGIYRSGYFAMLLKNKIGIPFVTTSHGDIFTSPKGSQRISRPRVKRRMVKILKSADYITHLTPLMAEKANDIYPSEYKSIVIGNGINTDIYKELHNHKSEYLLSLGRLVPSKGFNILIDAYSELVKSGVKNPFIIAGEGDQKQELIEQAKKHKLNVVTDNTGIDNLPDKSIIFPGYISGEDKMKLLCSAKIQLFATQEALFSEGFSIVFLEALAAKNPLIASDTELHRYFKSIGVKMNLVECDDVKGWTNEIMKLLRTEEKNLKQITDDNFDFVQQYQWKDIAEQYKKIYMKIMKNM